MARNRRASSKPEAATETPAAQTPTVDETVDATVAVTADVGTSDDVHVENPDAGVSTDDEHVENRGAGTPDADDVGALPQGEQDPDPGDGDDDDFDPDHGPVDSEVLSTEEEARLEEQRDALYDDDRRDELDEPEDATEPRPAAAAEPVIFTGDRGTRTITRRDERSWWCPFCGTSMPHEVDTCVKCGAVSDGDTATR